MVVDKKDKVVRIRGSDPDAVQRARDIMEFQVGHPHHCMLFSMGLGICGCVALQIARIPVKSDEVPSIMGTGGENIHDIQYSSGCLNIVLEQVCAK